MYRGKGRRSKDTLMKKYALAIAIATSGLFGLSAQAAPVSSTASGLQGQVSGDIVQVRHCRWSSGHGCGGWGGGGYYYGGHSRYWSHRRWGSGGWGGGGYYGHGRYWSHRRWGSGGW
jgi:hypothetical protein